MPAKKIVEETDKRGALKTLLKAKAPGIFEKEPHAAYAEGNLEALLDAILKI